MTLLEHLDLVQRRVEALDPAKAAAFGLLCTERQWPVLSRAARYAAWSQDLLPQFRQALDATWDQVESWGFATTEEGHPEIPLAPEDIIGSGEDGCVTNSDTVAFYLLNALSDLLSSIHEGNPTYSHCSAARNIDMIETLLGEVQLPPGRSEAMIKSELARQLHDLDSLATVASPCSLRQSHAVPDIYEGVWFHNDS